MPKEDVRTLGGRLNTGTRGSKVRLIEDICNYIRSNPSKKITLQSLERRFGINRFSLQKSFKEIMGITPRKYLEECRISLLKKNIRSGEPVPDAIYSAGYNSQSWLYKDSTSKLGMHPSAYRNEGEGARINFLTAKCILGYLMVAETEKGICSVSIADSEGALIASLRTEYPNASISRSRDAFPRLNAILNYFEGQSLNLPLNVRGTDFQKRVWSAIASIPYGETRSYHQVAEMIGKPKAYRAVANACAANPVPLIVPCHRVIRKDGNIGGYGLGPDRKKYLLEMEKSRGKPHGRK